MPRIIVFDADNTIWDTDAVFREAQLALLRTLADAKLLTNPEAHLTQLRVIDQQLMSLHSRAEYAFDTLASALVIFFLQGCTVEQAATAAIVDDKEQILEEYGQLIRAAHAAFDETMLVAPPLFPDALPVLSSIRASSSPAHPLTMILFSEGDVSRIERVLSAHRFRERTVFDEILILEKNLASMTLARTRGVQRLGNLDDGTGILAIFVGDSMRRDIKFANQAGFITVYKPTAYKGLETPQEHDEMPDHMINSLAELPGVLRTLGFDIPAVVS